MHAAAAWTLLVNGACLIPHGIIASGRFLPITTGHPMVSIKSMNGPQNRIWRGGIADNPPAAQQKSRDLNHSRGMVRVTVIAWFLGNTGLTPSAAGPAFDRKPRLLWLTRRLAIVRLQPSSEASWPRATCHCASHVAMGEPSCKPFYGSHQPLLCLKKRTIVPCGEAAKRLSKAPV